MKYNFLENKVILSDIDDFSLEQTFECGQCFRWQKINPSAYSGVAFGKELKITQENNAIVLYCNEKDFTDIWYNYFDLGTDYSTIKKQLSQMHPILKKAIKNAAGIRILKQEPFETICSFIISQNNNIPRISSIIKTLCENFGKKLPGDNFSFITAQKLANLKIEDLKILKCGFRDKYLLDAAKKIYSNQVDLDAIFNMDMECARLKLKEIYGVGPKIAECILLYGFHRLKAFPIDIWMFRALETFKPKIDIEALGENAGIAQQYLYHFSRTHKEIFENSR